VSGPDAKGRDRGVIRVTVDVPMSFRPGLAPDVRLFIGRDYVLTALEQRAASLRALRIRNPYGRPRRYMRPKIHSVHEVAK
jgi:hypothetical protein